LDLIFKSFQRPVSPEGLLAELKGLLDNAR